MRVGSHSEGNSSGFWPQSFAHRLLVWLCFIGTMALEHWKPLLNIDLPLGLLHYIAHENVASIFLPML